MMRPIRPILGLSIMFLGLALTGCPDDDRLPIGATCGDNAECELGLCYGGVCLDPNGDYALAFTLPPPEQAVAGVPFSVTVTLVDAGGAALNRFAGPVSLSLSGGSGDAVLEGPTSATAAAGVATFDGLVVPEAASDLVLVATSGTLVTSESPAFDVVSGAFAALLVSGAPGATVAGDAFDLTLTAVDDHGNTVRGFDRAVRFEGTDPLATLPDDATFTASDAGTRTFEGVTLRTAGPQTITVVDAGTEATLATVAVTVTHAQADLIRMSGMPEETVAGQTITLTVAVVDAFDNLVADYAGTVRFSSTDLGATLPDDLTFTPADSGTRQITFTLVTAGSQTLEVRDVAAETLSGSGAATVRHAEAAEIIVTVLTSPLVAGSPVDVEVRVVDAYGNVVTDYEGTVELSSSDPMAVLPPAYTFTPQDGGVRVFEVTLVSAGEHDLGASSDDGAVRGGSEVLVDSAPDLDLVLTGIPSPIVAGQPFDVTVRVTDVFGNTIADFDGVVALSVLGAAAEHPGPQTLTPSDGGIAVFAGVALHTAGEATVRASLPDLGVTRSVPVDVIAGPAHELVVSPLTGTVTAGQAFDLAVRVEDAFGNTAAGYTGAVSFASDDPHAAAVTPANTNFGAADAGERTFSVTFATAGSRSLIVTAAGLTGPAEATVTRTVSPAAVARFALAPSNVSPGAGATFSIMVTPEDAFDNVVTTFSGQVSVSTNPSGGGPSTAALSGVTTVTGFSFTQAGDATITVQHSGGASGSTQVTVVPGAPVALAFTEQPALGHVNVPLTSFQVSLRDAHGNVATNASATPITVTIGRNANQGSLSGTTTVSTASGRANFSNVVLDRPGVGWTLRASGSVGAAESARFDTRWRAPSIVGTPTVTSSGSCHELDYTVSQPDGQPVDLWIEYRVGSTGPWHQATQAPSEAGEASGLVAVPTASSGGMAAPIGDPSRSHTFKWDSVADLGPVDVSGMRLRITPFMRGVGSSQGATVPSSVFAVHHAFSVSPRTHPVNQAVQPIASAVADFDGNGLLDIVVANGATSVNRLLFYYQTAPGQFTQVLTNAGETWQSRYAAMAVAEGLSPSGYPGIVTIDTAFADINVFTPTVGGVGDVTWRLTYPDSPACAWQGPASAAPAPVDVAVGRLTMGPRPDVAVACWDQENATGSVGILTDSQGSWYLMTIESIPGRPTAVAVADLGGTGGPAIVVTHDSAVSTITRWYSEGFCTPDSTGSGCPAQRIGVGAPAVHLAVADLDFDGEPDVVVAHGTTTLTIIPGHTTFDGQGQPAAHLDASRVFTVTAPIAVDRVHIADLDGDGKPDIIAASRSSDSVAVLFGDGRLGFPGDPLVLSTGGVTDGGAVGLAVADLYGDGGRDVVVGRRDASAATRAVSVVDGAPRAVCNPGFDGPGSAPVRAWRSELAPTAPVRDGKPGAIWHSTQFDSMQAHPEGAAEPVSGHGFAIAEGDGAGGFASEVNAWLGGTSRFASAAFGYLDEDDLLDAVIVDGVTDNVRVLYQDPTAQGGWVPSPSFSPDAAQTRGAVVAGDIDGDGRDDIAYAATGNTIRVLLRAAAGFEPLSPAIATTSLASRLALADLNFDGMLDVGFVTATSVCTHISGPGGFSGAVGDSFCYPDDNVTSPLHFVDMDGDGVHELVYVNSFGGDDPAQVRIRRQQPAESGDFALVTGVPVCVSAAGLAIADFNDDGRLDLLVGCLPGHPGEIHFQTASGGFAGSSVTFDGPGWDPLSMAAADLRGDHLPDAILGTTLFGSRASAPGSFRLPPLESLTYTSSSNQIRFTDIDGDGIPDAVGYRTSTLTFPFDLFWAPGLGDGSFGPTVVQSLEPSISIRAAELADVFGDGRPELVTATASQLRIYRQSLVRGEFEDWPWTTATLTASPTRLVVGAIVPRGLADIIAMRSAGFEILRQTWPGSFDRLAADPQGRSAFAGAGFLAVRDAEGTKLPITASACPNNVRCLTTWVVQSCSDIAFIPCWRPLSSTTISPTSGHTIADIAIADLNGDGLDDVVVLRNQQSLWHAFDVFLQNPSTPGTFLAAKSYSGRPGMGLSLSVVDVDGDGRLDIVGQYQSAPHYAVEVLYQEGPASSPTFSEPRSVVSTLTNATTHVESVDLNLDGRLDLAVGSPFSRAFRVFLGR